MTKEQERRVKILIETHGGKMMFGIGEVAKITGIGANRLPARLHECAIKVAKVGTSKLVKAEDVILFMDTIACLAPTDNTSRGLYTLDADGLNDIKKLHARGTAKEASWLHTTNSL